MTNLRAHWRLAIFAALVAVQVIFVVGAVAREEYLLNTGTEIRLRTRPVDPWDPLRGQFVALGYDINDLSNRQTNRWLGDQGDTVFVVLAERDDGIWVAVDASPERESETSRSADTVVIRGTITQWNAVRLLVTYNNIDRFYVPEGTQDPESQPIAIVVVSGDGEARLKRLEVDGEAWP